MWDLFKVKRPIVIDYAAVFKPQKEKVTVLCSSAKNQRKDRAVLIGLVYMSFGA